MYYNYSEGTLSIHKYSYVEFANICYKETSLKSSIFFYFVSLKTKSLWKKWNYLFCLSSTKCVRSCSILRFNASGLAQDKSSIMESDSNMAESHWSLLALLWLMEVTVPLTLERITGEGLGPPFMPFRVFCTFIFWSVWLECNSWSDIW